MPACAFTGEKGLDRRQFQGNRNKRKKPQDFNQLQLVLSVKQK